MKRDPSIFIAHILECIQLVEEYTGAIPLMNSFNPSNSRMLLSEGLKLWVKP